LFFFVKGGKRKEKKKKRKEKEKKRKIECGSISSKNLIS